MTEGKHTTVTLKERISAHFAIARLDHSIKNLFVLPGVIIPLSIYPALMNKASGVEAVAGACIDHAGGMQQLRD